MKSALNDNLAGFNLSRFIPEIKANDWEKAVQKVSQKSSFNLGKQNHRGWAGLMENCLGEGQFGHNRYSLRPLLRFFYKIKPLLPKWAIMLMRNNRRIQHGNGFKLNWPIEDRFVRFFWECIENISQKKSFPIWPEGKKFAFVLTHDVESERGLKNVRKLAGIETDYGFRSSFNFAPERYSVAPALREELVDMGFEVGIHGLRHDGKLFLSKKIFKKRADRINYYLKEWDSVGFRSPLTHRNPEWMQILDIEYDMSFFDTDPYETMPGGTMSIWPFSIGRFIELPYTLPQDSTLFPILKQTDIRIWRDKVDWIAENRGMVLVNVHPDYIDLKCGDISRNEKSSSNGSYPLRFYTELLEYVKAKGGFWHALPREAAEWWRERTRTSLHEVSFPC